MADSMPSSWRDPRYLATVIGLLAFGVIVFYAGLTDGSLTPESVAVFAVAIGVGARIGRYLLDRAA